MDLSNLQEYKISLNEFPLHWRFNDESYVKLDLIHLDQIQPVVPSAANFLWSYSSDLVVNICSQQGFKFFEVIEINDKTFKKWLFKRGLAFQKEIYVIWQPDLAVITHWKIFIKFFNDFYYFPDELAVFDNSLNWGIFIKNGQVIFASNNYD